MYFATKPIIHRINVELFRSLKQERILKCKRNFAFCLKPNHSAENCDKNFTCFKCKGKHHVGICTYTCKGKHVGICTYTPKESDKNDDSKSDKNDEKVDSDDAKKKVEDKTEKDDKNVLNVGIATLNLCQKNSVLLETAQPRVETPDCKRSKLLRILFDNGSHVSFITPKAKRLLNLGAKGSNKYSIKPFGNNKTKKELENVRSNKYSIKPFGNNEIKKELENVDIVINTLNHEKILMKTLVFGP